MMSDRVLYGREFEAVAMGFRKEFYVWGEELTERKLILFSQKTHNFQNLPNRFGKVKPCGLVVVCNRKDKTLYCVSAGLSLTTGNVFLSEKNFNDTWAELRKNVQDAFGRKFAREKNGTFKAEDILDLRLLERPGSTPSLEKNRIVYVAKDESQEKKVHNSRKQRLLDDPNLFFYYAETGGNVHDKECDWLKAVPAHELCASAQKPEDRELCPKCVRKLLLRVACSPRVKQIPMCNKFLRDGGVGTWQLRRMVLTSGLHFDADDLQQLIVTGREDTWHIRRKKDGSMQLWHNNYVRVSETERYITEGFHNQGMDGCSLLFLLQYIEGYSWHTHLAQEAKRERRQEEAAAALEPISAKNDEFFVGADRQAHTNQEEHEKSATKQWYFWAALAVIGLLLLVLVWKGM